jgi:Tfp pilus assembly protein PilF
MTIRSSRFCSLTASLLLANALLAGCGSSETPVSAVKTDDGIHLVAPQQIQRALSQLSSTDARQQASGLEFVDQYPSLVESHRSLIEKLAEAGASDTIKLRAAKLLEEKP